MWRKITIFVRFPARPNSEAGATAKTTNASMDILASIIKTIFGSKADKDRKEIEPYLQKIKAVYPSIEALSNDELRARSEALKKAIADFTPKTRPASSS